MLYHNHQVPIVISTDDAGILRSNLIEQFVLLAKRYKDIGYADIKQFVLNSIEYSFIRDQKLKERLTKNLTEKIAAFEKEIMNSVKKK
jgi:adenosine deaminase